MKGIEDFLFQWPVKGIVYLGLVSCAFWLLSCRPVDTGPDLTPAVDHGVTAADLEAMRLATLQITMIFREQIPLKGQAPALSGAAGQTAALATTTSNGLGTLIAFEGKTYLLTHDHWSGLASGQQPDEVIFSDVDGRMLLSVSAAQFQPAVVYHDPGVMVIEAPREFAGRGVTWRPMGVQPDAAVVIARRHRDNPLKVEFQPAQIVGLAAPQGTSQFILKMRPAETIEPGDSGGGVWLGGEIIGNVWMTVRHSQRVGEAERLLPTDRGIAAALDENLPGLIQILGEAHLPPVTAGGLH